MSILLAIDTSSAATFVALQIDEGFPFERRCVGQNHSESLAALVKEVLFEANVKAQHLGGLVVGSGPGSFTGLRIGYAFMKGLAYALSLPLQQISSLLGFAHEFLSDDNLVVSLADARRQEFFAALYTGTPRFRTVVEPCIIPGAELPDLVERHRRLLGIAADQVVFVGGEPGLRVMERPLESSKCAAHSLLRVAHWDSKQQGDAGHSGSYGGCPAALAALAPTYLRRAAAQTIAERGRLAEVVDG